MLKKTVIIIYICLVHLSCHQNSVPDDITTIIEQIQHHYCPDKRLDLFTIRAQKMNRTIRLSGETNLPEAHQALISELNQQSQYAIRDEIELLPPKKRKRSYGIIRISTAHQRRQPSVKAEMINQAIMGQGVRIYKEKGLYYLTQLCKDGYMGWIMKSSIHEMTQAEYNTWQQRPKAIFMKINGWIWSKKNSASDPVCDLVWGSVLTAEEIGTEWTRLVLPDGRQGYVKSNQVLDMNDFEQQPAPCTKELVKSAKRCLGIPYLWGGRSTKAFDCSGFIQTIFKMNGIDLPRDANMQVKMGKPVEIDTLFEQAEVGDLLFFGAATDQITHVGMYIGDQKMIHSDGWVKINSFNRNDPAFDKDRFSRLQFIKRILPQ